jgi:hypothetical protein
MASLLMRATELGYVARPQGEYLWKIMSARKYRLREPPELDFEHERPTVLESLLRVHMEDLGYSPIELADLLKIHEGSMRRVRVSRS